MTTILLNLHNAGIIDCLTFNIPFQQKAPTRRSLSI
ncbi:MAG: hypothetical protein M0O95_05570 [Clostridiales bacterium]|nr:hypothetical protein [Clostridiales bacterium]MCK9349951.1 hypothetical protein [Clostridiales bacterium]